MLYQLSYTPRPPREVARANGSRKVQWTIGKPIHVPPGPVKTRWVAER